MCKKTTNHQSKERNVASSIHPPCGREASFVGNPLSCQGSPLGTQLPGGFFGLASTKAAQESSCNPTGARAPETLLKEFQLLEAFTGTSRCVCFKGFFPGLIPTCDNRKHSQKFLSHRRSTCKRGPKMDKEHSLDSPTELLEVQSQLFSVCYAFPSLLGERLQPPSTESNPSKAVFKGKRHQQKVGFISCFWLRSW